jgi:hypothetical protein
MLKPVPIRLTKRITDIGGKAENGLSLFRVLRGADRFTLIGGEWRHHDVHGNETGSHVGVERVLKYPGTQERYIFEMWMATEYTSREWEEHFTEYIGGERIETLGPYPKNGEYELVRVLEKVRVDKTTGAIIAKEFVPLTESLCDALVLTAKMNRELPGKHKQLAAQERREREEKAKDARLSERIEDMQRPSFARQQSSEKQRYIIVPGEERKSNGGIIRVN